MPIDARLKRNGLQWLRPLAVPIIVMMAWTQASGTSLAAEQEPQRGGTIIVGTESEPSTLNPYVNSGSETVAVSNHVFEKLVNSDLQFNIVPAFAESWQVSKDGLSYTFKIKKGAKWTDGVPATSKDVQWSLMEVARKYHPRLGALLNSSFDRVDTPDDQTAVLHLKAPFAPLLNILAAGGGPVILPQHVYGDGKDIKTHPANIKPVGSGPYKLESWVQGSHLVLARNDDYPVKDRAYLDRIIFQFLPDVNSRWLALENGEVDFLNYYMVPLEQVARGESNPDLVLDERGGEGTGALSGIIVNTRKGPIAKREVRQALAYAIDRGAIVKLAFLGRGKIGKSVMSSGLVQYFNKDAPFYEYNTEKANALLDAAGYPRGSDGTRFSIRLTWATGRDVETSIAELMQDQLRKVGIKLELQRADRATAIQSIYVNWDFDLALWVLATGPEPTMQVTRSYETKNIKPAPFTNASGYSNPVTDQLFNTEFSVTEPEKRREMWNKIQEILMTDLPFLPLVELPVTNFYNKKFVDVITTPYTNSPDVSRAWMRQ